ncbi:aminopeptidase [bacterium]|nr:aminopeptidase [bacterium]
MASRFIDGTGGATIQSKQRITVILVGATLLAAFFASGLVGCSPAYLARAALTEAEILLNREPILEVLDPEYGDREQLTADLRANLRWVLRARDFAESIGLTAKGSFTTYSHREEDVLAWVLIASKKDAFEPYTWWYPIVGRVPYKGFFEKEDAQCLTERLEARGYEVAIRGTPAFSTLGWFNDPVLTPALKHPPHEVVNTVIHEIFHQTVWIPGSVAFNESAANVVGALGAIEFFHREAERCTSASCRSEMARHQLRAERSWAFERELGILLTETVSALEALYASTELTTAEKLAQREALFHEHTAPFRQRYPELSLLSELNNAALLQLFLYRQELGGLEELFLRCEKKWSCFLAELQQIADTAGEGDPFTHVKERK